MNDMAMENTAEKKLVFVFKASAEMTGDSTGAEHRIVIAHPKQDLSDQGEKADAVYETADFIAQSEMFATAKGHALDTFVNVYYEAQTKNPVINNRVNAMKKLAETKSKK